MELILRTLGKIEEAYGVKLSEVARRPTVERVIVSPSLTTRQLHERDGSTAAWRGGFVAKALATNKEKRQQRTRLTVCQERTSIQR